MAILGCACSRPTRGESLRLRNRMSASGRLRVQVQVNTSISSNFNLYLCLTSSQNLNFYTSTWSNTSSSVWLVNFAYLHKRVHCTHCTSTHMSTVLTLVLHINFGQLVTLSAYTNLYKYTQVDCIRCTCTCGSHKFWSTCYLVSFYKDMYQLVPVSSFTANWLKHIIVELKFLETGCNT